MRFASSGLRLLPKVAGADVAQGAPLLWDASAGGFDVATATPAAGDVFGGAVVVAAAGPGTTTVRAKLTPGAGVLSS